ncbi:MAG TPA: hypothetical protein DCL06_10135 [Corynebacterium variabile]|uniref:Uncharacterized protein n=1 Tax=Corynebacterium variabile TaxID=1727 RepID=A0A3B9QVW5_9CORY|nr:hypothetical protein [Corynebacterium variabile]
MSGPSGTSPGIDPHRHDDGSRSHGERGVLPRRKQDAPPGGQSFHLAAVHGDAAGVGPQQEVPAARRQCDAERRQIIKHGAVRYDGKA